MEPIILGLSPNNINHGNTEGGSITVQLASCLTGLDLSLLLIKTKIVSWITADSKPVKQYSDTSPFSITCINLSRSYDGLALEKNLTSWSPHLNDSMR
jgi:hypothetical protein